MNAQAHGPLVIAGPVLLGVAGVVISQIAGSMHGPDGFVLALLGGACVGVSVVMAYFKGVRA